MKPILVTLVLASAVLFTGCNRALVLKTLLESDEKISKGDIVLVDGAAAGTVKRVAVDGVNRAAEFAITDEAAKSKLRVGIVRLREDGRILLRTDAVDAQAPQLANGAMVPLISKPGLAVRQFASSRMWPLLLMGLAIILVALLLFRRMARSWMLLLALVLSGGVAWVALPWTSGAVANVFSRLTPATGGIDAAPRAGLAQALSKLIGNPPDPQVVAYAAAFIAAFIILSVLLRFALDRLECRG
jgi:hypothetical protein